MADVQSLPPNRRLQIADQIDGLIQSGGYTEEDRPDLVNHYAEEYSNSDVGKKELSGYKPKEVSYPVADKVMNYVPNLVTGTGAAIAGSMAGRGNPTPEALGEILKGNMGGKEYVNSQLGIPPDKMQSVIDFVTKAAADPMNRLGELAGLPRGASAPIAEGLDDAGRATVRAGGKKLDSIVQRVKQYRTPEAATAGSDLIYDNNLGAGKFSMSGMESDLDKLMQSRGKSIENMRTGNPDVMVPKESMTTYSKPTIEEFANRSKPMAGAKKATKELLFDLHKNPDQLSLERSGLLKGDYQGAAYGPTFSPDLNPVAKGAYKQIGEDVSQGLQEAEIDALNKKAPGLGDQFQKLNHDYSVGMRIAPTLRKGVEQEAGRSGISQVAGGLAGAAAHGSDVAMAILAGKEAAKLNNMPWFRVNAGLGMKGLSKTNIWDKMARRALLPQGEDEQ